MQSEEINVPTILMAGFEDFDEPEMKQFGNVVRFFHKPVETEPLLRAVRRCARAPGPAGGPWAGQVWVATGSRAVRAEQVDEQQRAVLEMRRVDGGDDVAHDAADLHAGSSAPGSSATSSTMPTMAWSTGTNDGSSVRAASRLASQ